MSFNRGTEWAEIIGWSGPAYGFSEPEQLLSAFFADSAVGLSIVDTQLNYQAINNALAEMNGFPVEYHLGKSMRDILGNAAESIEPILRQVLLTSKPVTNIPLTLQLPTRKEPGHWVVHYFPMNDASGKVTRIGVVVVEVTEQKRLEEKLASLANELEQEKDRRRMLLEVSEALYSNSDLQHSFRSISAGIRKVIPQDWADLSILDGALARTHMYVADFPLDAKFAMPGVSIPLAESLCGQAIALKQPTILNRSDLTAIRSTCVEKLLEKGIKSACCIPFVTPEGSVGCFSLASVKDLAFRLRDLDLFKLLTLELANALDRTPARRGGSDVAAKTEKLTVKTVVGTEAESNVGDIVGKSPALRRVLDQAKTVARSDTTVLILGETGTGKELIARAVHQLSLRKNGPFIKLNCAAIPSGLLESELFGHEKGAFTGAVSQKAGRLELADRGTLFLDEVGDLPMELQPKLLRVLQDQEFERLGGNRTIRVDIRLLAATNQDLSASLAQRKFRADLFYRLNVFPIRLPPLRERSEDIEMLVQFFIRKYAARMKKKIDGLPPESMSRLLAWEWPGNIRELENFIERAVILSEGPVLDIPLTELQPQAAPTPITLEGMGREYILRALRECDGVLDGPRGAASRLGMTPGALQSTMQRMKILRADYRG
jgi:formate hydrogenlyase transcriptional activator